MQTNDQINAVIAKVSPYVPVEEVAAALSRWKHLTTLTQEQQETLLSKFVIEKARNQQRLIMVLLIIVSAVIIALIIYTLTMDKVRSIATLKFVGAPDRTIIGLIVQQALSMGIFGYFAGLALVLIFQPYFPRRLVLDPTERRHRVRHHRRDLSCRQHARHPAGAESRPGGSAGGGGVSHGGQASSRSCASSICPSISAPAARGSTRCVDINMEVYPGQVVGLMGPSGSGKTTLLNCIACILEPSSGRLTLDGEVVYDDHWLKADLRRLRLDKVGFIFQYPNLLPFLDGTDNVAVVLDLAGYSVRGGAHARRRPAQLSRRRAPQACHAGATFRRRSAAGGDRARTRQPSAHYPRRRADGAARFGRAPAS